MRLRIEKASRLPRWPLWACAIVAVWLGLVGAITLLGKVTGHQSELCQFKRITHLPCPTCGSTRMCLSLLAGNPAEAASRNPLMFVAILGLAAYLLARLALARTVRLDMSRPQRRAAWALAGALFLANWLYVIRYVG